MLNSLTPLQTTSHSIPLNSSAWSLKQIPMATLSLCSSLNFWAHHQSDNSNNRKIHPLASKCGFKQNHLSILQILKNTRRNAIQSSERYPSLEQQSDTGIRSDKKDNPPIAPALFTSLGPYPLDLISVLLRSRIIFVGEYINSQAAQRIISQLVTLATIDSDADILMYINCPGGTPYSVLAVYDCMQWIKPKVGTVCIGIAVSHAALLLIGGEKGMRYSMPNSRIMIHQPQGGFVGNIHDVGPQVNEALSLRDKYDKIYAAISGQPLEVMQGFSDRDRYFSAAEALDVGLIDGLMETEY